MSSSRVTVVKYYMAVYLLFCLLRIVLTSEQQRFIYVIPYDKPLSVCPTENCYSLNRLYNMSFNSNTVLEGTHVYSNTQNKVVIIESVNFVLAAVNTAGAVIKGNAPFAFILGLLET